MIESVDAAMEETMLDSQLADQPFMVSTLISSELSHSQLEDDLSASNPPPLQDDYSNPLPPSNDYTSPPKPSNQNMQASDYLDVCTTH